MFPPVKLEPRLAGREVTGKCSITSKAARTLRWLVPGSAAERILAGRILAERILAGRIRLTAPLRCLRG